MSARPSNQHGFTLIEMVVTVAIVALLASVALPLAEVSARRGKEHELRLALREIRSALDAYRQAVEEGRVASAMHESGYPGSLQLLVDGVPDASSPDRKKRIYFLRRIPRDPLFPDPARPAEESWGKRSYASSPDAPEEGADVFDVYTRAPGTGLNGIPSNRW
ncbi:MAG: type II secretion system protein [Ramlibacter sp.]